MSSKKTNSESMLRGMDEDEEEEEEIEEEEEEEEDEEEWDELKPLEELDELDDGPSTFFVGGFSVCKKLSTAIENVKFKEDRVLIFPGVHGGPQARCPADRDDLVELDEYLCDGLQIEGVPYYLGKKAGYPVKDLCPKVGRRVGPWCTYYAAASAAATSATASASGGEGHLDAVQGGGSTAAGGILLPSSSTAIPGGTNMMRAKMEQSSSASTTSMASSVYGTTITPTKVDASMYPVLATRLVLKYDYRSAEEKEADPRKPLKHYVQLPDDDEEERDEDGEGGGEDDGDEDDQRRSGGRGGEEEDDGDEEGEEEEEDTWRSRRAPTITIQGICLLGGLVVEPLTRSLVRHCVLGIPTTVMRDFPITERITVEAKALGEVTLRNCIIYGGTAYGIYAYPRSAINVQQCIIDGPGTTEVLLQGGDRLRSVRHLSSLALLEYRTRMRAGGGSGGGGGMGGASASRLYGEKGRPEDYGMGGGGADGAVIESMANFVIPSTVVCDVGIFCDDADIEVVDCMISNTRLGICFHDACEHCLVTAVDVRCCKEVGIFYFGASGCARLIQSCIACCGRECILVKGLHEAEVREKEREYKIEHHIVDKLPSADGQEEDDEEEDEDEEGEGDVVGPRSRVKTKHPVFAQHPSIKKCSVKGGVRLQGEIRTGAIVDNLVFRPLKGGAWSVAAVGGRAAAAALAGGNDLIVGPHLGASHHGAVRGFLFSGIEGNRITSAVESD